MKAGVASPDGVVIKDVTEPKPKPAEMLVRIRAIALNRADLGSARGARDRARPGRPRRAHADLRRRHPRQRARRDDREPSRAGQARRAHAAR